MTISHLIHQIYLEKELIEHPLAIAIIQKYPQVTVTTIDSYREIFNRKKQDFRVQKNTPCLIIAKKYGKYVHQIPETFGIGYDLHYYFSCVINCPFDCRYCFLQGLNRSAHYVLFVNCEDFKESITKVCNNHADKRICFFSGYDSDSLALDAFSNFSYNYLPFFETLSNAHVEVRTKSIRIKPLLEIKTTKNTIVAYTLNPQKIIDRDEKKTPSLKDRLKAILKLQEAGYQIALRFDPMMMIENGLQIYGDFFDEVFNQIALTNIHSVTVGSYRLPKTVYQNYAKIAPFDFRLALLEEKPEEEFAYPNRSIEKLLNHAEEKILTYLPSNKLYRMQKL